MANVFWAGVEKVFIRMIWQNLLGVGWKKIQGCGAKFRVGGRVAKIIWEVGEHFL